MSGRAISAAALLAALVGACSPSAAGTPPPSLAPSAAATTTAVEPTATPQATLPGGLEPRAGRPPIVDGEAAACIPLCGEGQISGGKLPAGRYQTEWFFGGYMTLETDGTWERAEDRNGELVLPLAAPEGIATYSAAFFLDPAMVVDAVVQDVPRRAADYVAWLAKHEYLVVSAPIATTVGSVPALAVDIRLAADAPSQADDCLPDPCVAFIRPAGSRDSDGILGDDVSRYYFADIEYSGTPHMLWVKVDGRDAPDLQAQLPRVEAMLSTVKLPARAAPSALIGSWSGFHHCERILAMMTAAGMPEQALLNIADSGTLAGVSTVDQINDPKHPCLGAVDQRHSHFFTADGLFGSRDMHDQQVDDGTWTLIDASTVSINGTPFDFEVIADELRLEPVDVGTCPRNGQWCQEAWKLMVAMPGMAWTRAD